MLLKASCIHDNNAIDINIGTLVATSSITKCTFSGDSRPNKAVKCLPSSLLMLTVNKSPGFDRHMMLVMVPDRMMMTTAPGDNFDDFNRILAGQVSPLVINPEWVMKTFDLFRLSRVMNLLFGQTSLPYSKPELSNQPLVPTTLEAAMATDWSASTRLSGCSLQGTIVIVFREPDFIATVVQDSEGRAIFLGICNLGSLKMTPSEIKKTVTVGAVINLPEPYLHAFPHRNFGILVDRSGEFFCSDR